MKKPALLVEADGYRLEIWVEEDGVAAFSLKDNKGREVANVSQQSAGYCGNPPLRSLTDRPRSYMRAGEKYPLSLDEIREAVVKEMHFMPHFVDAQLFPLQ